MAINLDKNKNSYVICVECNKIVNLSDKNSVIFTCNQKCDEDYTICIKCAFKSQKKLYKNPNFKSKNADKFIPYNSDPKSEMEQNAQKHKNIEKILFDKTD